MNLGEGLGPVGFIAQIQCAAWIGSSGASGTSTVHPADYNGPFHGWTKTDGGAGSAIHPIQTGDDVGGGKLDFVKVGRYKNKWV